MNRADQPSHFGRVLTASGPVMILPPSSENSMSHRCSPTSTRVRQLSGICPRYLRCLHITCSDRSPTCPRSEEHTSELQSLRQLVCRLLLEKKKIDKVG